jgi:hypothetical protein
MRQRLREDYPAALGTIVHSAAVPYGITLTVWGSGALVMHFRGPPRVFEVFLFVLGGVVGYALATMPAIGVTRTRQPSVPGSHLVLAGMLHPLAIGAALGSVTLVAMIQGWVAWPLGGLCGIAVYLLLVGVEYAFAGHAASAPDEQR